MVKTLGIYGNSGDIVFLQNVENFRSYRVGSSGLNGKLHAESRDIVENAVKVFRANTCRGAAPNINGSNSLAAFCNKTLNSSISRMTFSTYRGISFFTLKSSVLIKEQYCIG
jgi:hypothetical protein